MVFPTYVQFCTQIVVLYLLEPFKKLTFFAHLEKMSHILRINLSIVLQANNNRSTSMIKFPPNGVSFVGVLDKRRPKGYQVPLG